MTLDDIRQAIDLESFGAEVCERHQRIYGRETGYCTLCQTERRLTRKEWEDQQRQLIERIFSGRELDAEDH